MVSVGQNDLRVDVFQINRIQTFDRRLRADRHKNRGFNIAVFGMQNPRARLRVFIFVNNVKKVHIIIRMSLVA